MGKKYEKELSLDQLAALTDADIDYSDIPELDETFWENAIYVEPEACNSAPRSDPEGSILA